MDPITLAMAGQAAGSAIGGISDLFGGRDDEELKRALAELQALNPDAARTAAAKGALKDQQGTIRALQSLYEQGGMDPQARAALAQAQQSNASNEQMARNALTQQYRMMGQGGGGTQLAAQLANQQGAANRNAATGTQVAADARTRALQGLLSSGQMAGQVRGQEDAFNQFNASQRLRKAGMVAGTADSYGSRKDEEDQKRTQQLGGLGRLAGGFYGGGF